MSTQQIFIEYLLYEASQMAIVVKKPPSNAGNVRDVGSIPQLARFLGGGQPTSVFLPGESQRQRSLTGYSPWGHKKLDTTERLTLLVFAFR